jgi:hypothetical protein
MIYNVTFKFKFSTKICKTKENVDLECVKYYNMYIIDSIMEYTAGYTS